MGTPPGAVVGFCSTVIQSGFLYLSSTDIGCFLSFLNFLTFVIKPTLYYNVLGVIDLSLINAEHDVEKSLKNLLAVSNSSFLHLLRFPRFGLKLIKQISSNSGGDPGDPASTPWLIGRTESREEM